MKNYKMTDRKNLVYIWYSVIHNFHNKSHLCDMFRLIFQSMFMTLFKNFSENIQMQTGERSHPIQICGALAGNVAYYKVNNYKK
jgi:hypothetical protein